MNDVAGKFCLEVIHARDERIGKLLKEKQKVIDEIEDRINDAVNLDEHEVEFSLRNILEFIKEENGQ